VRVWRPCAVPHFGKYEKGAGGDARQLEPENPREDVVRQQHEQRRRPEGEAFENAQFPEKVAGEGGRAEPDAAEGRDDRDRDIQRIALQPMPARASA
jgi:hypothetical protein